MDLVDIHGNPVHSVRPNGPAGDAQDRLPLNPIARDYHPGDSVLPRGSRYHEAAEYNAVLAPFNMYRRSNQVLFVVLHTENAPCSNGLIGPIIWVTSTTPGQAQNLGCVFWEPIEKPGDGRKFFGRAIWIPEKIKDWVNGLRSDFTISDEEYSRRVVEEEVRKNAAINAAADKAQREGIEQALEAGKELASIIRPSSQSSAGPGKETAIERVIESNRPKDGKGRFKKAINPLE